MVEDNNDYQRALETAHAELNALLVHHQAIEKRIAKLRQIIATLSALNELMDDDDESSQLEISARAHLSGITGSEMALSNAIREVLKASGKSMTSVQVRDGLLRMGFDPEKYTKALSVIHKALKRLNEKDEVTTGMTTDGKTTYQWANPIILTDPPYARRTNLKKRGGAKKNRRTQGTATQENESDKQLIEQVREIFG